jgi:hypothetical protein
MNHLYQTYQVLLPIVLCAALAGCSPAQPTASPATVPPAPTATALPAPTAAPTATPLPEGSVMFDRLEGFKFSGTVYGQGDTAIILANMIHHNNWDPFLKSVDRQKFVTLTFGYLQATEEGAAKEIGIVLETLRASGYPHVICIGASLGATACESIAGEPELSGLVLISGGGSRVVGGDYPKLYVAGESDPAAKDTQQAFQHATEPKTLVLYPKNAMHGTSLFVSTDGDAFLMLLIDFVDEIVQAG